MNLSVEAIVRKAAQEGYLIEVDPCEKSGDFCIRLRRIKEEVRKLLGERCCI